MAGSLPPRTTAVPGAGQATSVADLTLGLTRLGLTAPDLGSAMRPALDALVERTAAVGAGYFQLREGTLTFHARAASGAMPAGPVMEALLAHGLPADLPLLRALAGTQGALFFGDTRGHPEAAGFPELGVLALTAAPIHDGGGRLVGALLSHTFTPHGWAQEERALFAGVTGLLSLVAARLDAEEREQAAHEGALRVLGLTLEARDAETQGHTDRVTALAVRLGALLGLRDSALRALRWGAYLHDLGKISIPDAILHHPGRLDPSARARMEEHVLDGARLAEQLPFLPRGALDVILSHHEWWNGGGYPRGLAGEAIPLGARIFAPCDVYDALVSERPYKRAWTHAEAVGYLEEGSGTQFDPAVVAAFVRVLTGDGLLTPPPSA
ncbi:HD domain-containing phosphohydrolase [Deinococcus aestuarii]|uniref:HD domain-containing phosphohydrolase n=1 Tax=Deinococcus aestuarii TaxID=2774531 RepID=UPI001C0B23FA|nr:HD domain-containing phosphohydrolase [Deinococcus aestuarii]